MSRSRVRYRAPRMASWSGVDEVTVSVADMVMAAYVAEIDAEPGLHRTVDTVNAAVVAPWRTVTLAGMRAIPDGVPDNTTVAPPVGATAVRITVPTAGVPASTVDELSVTEAIVAGFGFTVNSADVV